MTLIKTEKHTKCKPNLNLNKQLTVTTAHECVRITVHNCHTQHSTVQLSFPLILQMIIIIAQMHVFLYCNW